MKSKNIDITLDSFLEINYSQELIRNLFNNKIYKMSEEEKEEFNFEHSKDKAFSFLSKLKSRILNEIQGKEIILFHLNYKDTGAIILRLEDVFKDINWIINFSGYSNGSFDFVVVEPNFNYGICIEGFEYWDTFTIWGFFH